MMSGFVSLKASVKDSLEEDEGSEDVEDEVFIRDGRNNCRIDDEIKRPLMAPRRKCKQNIAITGRRKCSICSPYCKLSLALFLLTCFALILISLFNDFSGSIERLKFWTLSASKGNKVIIPNTEFYKESVWVRTFPNLTCEDSMTLSNVNNDNIDDIIIGYSSGDGVPCFKRNEICLGGVMALDGKTGETLWNTALRHQVLFVDCSTSVTSHTTHDCLVSGKAGLLCTVNGKTGEIIWDLYAPNNARSSAYSQSEEHQVYSAQYIPDIDGDGWPDVLAALTTHSSSNLTVISGHSGHVVGTIQTPDRLLTLPRLITTQDEAQHVLFGTGTLDTPGFIFSIPLYSIINSHHSKIRKLWSGDGGVSSDMLLIDINMDKIEDIVVTSGGGFVTILDGNSYNIIWNISLGQQSQILVGPIPGYFDDDAVADLFITKLVGQDFPTFYYSQSQVYSGKNGSLLMEDSIIGSGDITGEGISLSFTGNGNDMFLYWLTSCNQTRENQTKPFSLPAEISMDVAATMDMCKVRFNATLETKLYLLSDHIQPPGFLIYSSDSSWSEEHSSEKPMDTTAPPVTLSEHRDQEIQIDVPQQKQPSAPDGEEGGYEGQDTVDSWDFADPLTRIANMKAAEAGAYLPESLPIDYANKLSETLDTLASNIKPPQNFNIDKNADNYPMVDGSKMSDNIAAGGEYSDNMADMDRRNKIPVGADIFNDEDYPGSRKKRSLENEMVDETNMPDSNQPSADVEANYGDIEGENKVPLNSVLLDDDDYYSKRRKRSVLNRMAPPDIVKIAPHDRNKMAAADRIKMAADDRERMASADRSMIAPHDRNKMAAADNVKMTDAVPTAERIIMSTHDRNKMAAADWIKKTTAESNKMAASEADLPDRPHDRNKMATADRIKMSSGSDENVKRKKRRTQHHHNSHTLPRSSTTPILSGGTDGSLDIIFASHWILSTELYLKHKCYQNNRSSRRRSWNSDCRDELRLGSDDQSTPSATNSQLTVYRVKLKYNCNILDSTREMCSTLYPAYSQSFSHRDVHQYFRQRHH